MLKASECVEGIFYEIENLIKPQDTKTLIPSVVSQRTAWIENLGYIINEKWSWYLKLNLWTLCWV